MSEQNQNPAEDETVELTAEELEKVNGGPTAVERMLLPAVKQGGVIPTDQFSLNFTKIAK